MAILTMYEDKLPPSNIEAEESVIAALMIDDNAISEVASMLKPDHFHHEKNRLAYEACLALYQRGEEIDQITLAYELGRKLELVGGMGWITSLIINIPTTAHTKYYANIVMQTAFQRAMIEVGDKIRAKAFDESQPRELIADCMKMILDMRPPGKHKLIHPSERAEHIMSILSIGEEGDTENLPFGFFDLDRETGGMAKGNLIIVGARPEIGKSTFAQQVAIKLTDSNKVVLLCSAEMSDKEYTVREIVAKTGIDIKRIGRVKLNNIENGRVQDAIGRITEQHLEFLGGNLTTTEIESAAKEVDINTGLDLIIVDYIQLLADSQGSSLNERVSYISRRLKQIAVELDVPVLAVSQLNRELEKRDDKHPNLASLRDSGSLEQDADVVLLLYRSGAYYNNEFDWKQSPYGRRGQPFEPSILEVLIAKHRQWGGGNRIVKLGWDEQKRQYRDLYEQP